MVSAVAVSATCVAFAGCGSGATVAVSKAPRSPDERLPSALRSQAGPCGAQRQVGQRFSCEQPHHSQFPSAGYTGGAGAAGAFPARCFAFRGGLRSPVPACRLLSAFCLLRAASAASRAASWLRLISSSSEICSEVARRLSVPVLRRRVERRSPPAAAGKARLGAIA